MNSENNEKEQKKATVSSGTGKGEAENGSAAPRKKLNIVFRKQNSSSIKDLPRGLKSAAGNVRKRSTETQRQETQAVKKPRPLPAGTKPVRPVLKEAAKAEAVGAGQAQDTELKGAANTLARAAETAGAVAAESTGAVNAKAQDANTGAANTANDLNAANAANNADAAGTVKTAADTSGSVPAGAGTPGEKDAAAGNARNTSASAEHTEAKAQGKATAGAKPVSEAKPAAEAKTAAESRTASGAENTAKKENTAGTSPAKSGVASGKPGMASNKKPADKAKEQGARNSLSGDAVDRGLPKVKIVKSYANYNIAQVLAEASRAARSKNASGTASGSGQRNGQSQRGANQRNGAGRGQGKPGEGGGRMFIARGSAASGGGNGRGQNGQRRPGGASPSAPVFDSQRNAGGRGRGSNPHGDRKDKRDKYNDELKSVRPKTGKGAFIKPEPKAERPEDEIKSITIPETLTIRDLAEKLRLQPSVIVKKLFLAGKMVTPNSDLSYEEAEEIALEYDILCEKEVEEDVIAEILKEDEEDESAMVVRNPVVCVMGHVDHGKTSLLDAIRNTNVTSHEAGGITQHIGASVVKAGDRSITFLDTPGHEAFTAMRLRGAQSTDIAVLVVAADDGVKPQTVEAISHAKAAGVEVVVAINKIDKPGANIDMVKQGLMEYELVAEEWGGSTPMVPVSAKTGEGIKELLDMILLEADVLELKANPNRNARGLVIEAELDKGRGPVATVLVQKGTLKVGDNVVAGSCYGKVRAMMDDKNNRIKKAAPSYPAEILGLNDVPNAGEVFMVCDDEKEARSIAETFIAEQKKHMLEETKQKMNLDDLFDEIKAGNIKELPIIVKADVQGSVEAVKQSLGKLSNDEVAVKVIHAAVGNINESDVILASTANAIIIGFNVKPDSTAKATAEQEKVDVRLYKVIYQAIDDLNAALTGMLAPVYEEKDTGRAIVRQLFKASGVGNIAGCYVTDGVVEKGSRARVFRGKDKIFDGDIASLKRFKDEVKEVKLGFECGIVLEDFNDIQVDDVLEVYKMVQVPRDGASPSSAQ